MLRASTLIATLGTQPQVITLALDALLESREAISEVIVLHTTLANNERLDLLRKEFTECARYVAHSVRLTTIPFTSGDQQLTDITTKEEAQAVLYKLYEQVEAVKRAGTRVHLSPAGGRKAMAMYAMLVAQILFDENDRLWLLVSAAGLQREGRLHALPGEASLLPVPTMPWHLSLMQKRTFLQKVLTPAEAEVLEYVARQGLTDGEIAAERDTTPKTTGHQLSTIYRKLTEFLEYPEGVQVNRHTVMTEFGHYFIIDDALRQSGVKSKPGSD